SRLILNTNDVFTHQHIEDSSKLKYIRALRAESNEFCGATVLQRTRKLFIFGKLEILTYPWIPPKNRETPLTVYIQNLTLHCPSPALHGVETHKTSNRTTITAI